MLQRRRAITARELHEKPHGSRVRACGLITMRQRPMTASGTIFLTLEDETGFVNAVIWPRLFEKQRAEILAASVLAVDGVLETDGDVHHLIASRVHDFSHLADGLKQQVQGFLLAVGTQPLPGGRFRRKPRPRTVSIRDSSPSRSISLLGTPQRGALQIHSCCYVSKLRRDRGKGH